MERLDYVWCITWNHGFLAPCIVSAAMLTAAMLAVMVLALVVFAIAMLAADVPAFIMPYHASRWPSAQFLNCSYNIGEEAGCTRVLYCSGGCDSEGRRVDVV
jgi:hypothetical protein